MTKRWTDAIDDAKQLHRAYKERIVSAEKTGLYGADYFKALDYCIEALEIWFPEVKEHPESVK